MIELKNKEKKEGDHQNKTLDFRKGDFNKLRVQVGRIPWEASIKGK